MADMVFVFFDPIGQALCKRTLNLVENLSEQRGDILRFYLSKADEAGHESDRQVGAAREHLYRRPVKRCAKRENWIRSCF